VILPYLQRGVAGQLQVAGHPLGLLLGLGHHPWIHDVSRRGAKTHQLPLLHALQVIFPALSQDMSSLVLWLFQKHEDSGRMKRTHNKRFGHVMTEAVALITKGASCLLLHLGEAAERY